MTAHIVGFVTREAAGLPRPKSISKKITPNLGGVAIHYGGPAQSAAEPNASHDLCVKTWRSWCRYHMNNRGYTDIAYTGGFCNHGYAFAGRGLKVRTAANGTNKGNQNFYAIVWIGGENQDPSPAAIAAADWWVNNLRQAGAGNLVRPHRFFKSTGCPGTILDAYAQSRNERSVSSPKTVSKPQAQTDSVVKRLQEIMGAKPDGKWGPNTDAAILNLRAAARAHRGWPNNVNARFDVKSAQTSLGVTADGLWGPKTQSALIVWVRKVQETLNLKTDTYWGPNTDRELLVTRKKYLNNY